MRLCRVEKRTAEPQNIQPQNFEGWNRCALSFYKIDRIPLVPDNMLLEKHSKRLV